MTGITPDLGNLAARLRKLEKQNRWLKLFCLLVVVHWLLGGVWGGTLIAKVLPEQYLTASEGSSAEKPGPEALKLEDIIKPENIRKTFKEVVDGLNRTR